MRSRRSLRAGFVGPVIVLALALAGCSSSGSENSTGDSTRVVQTDQGEVTVPADPQRVVVLNYALTGYLFNLDVPVVATTSEDFDRDAEFSEFWGKKPVENKTEFLTWGMDGFDNETILELDPDLIIAGGLGLPNNLAVDAYDQLSAIAPTVIVSKNLATWQQQLGFIAKDVLGQDDAFDDLVAAHDERVAEVKAAITVPPTPVASVSITADGTPYLLFEDQGLAKTLGELGFEPAPLVAENGLKPYTEGGDMAELSTEQAGQILADVPTLFVTGFNSDTTDVATLSKQPVWAALTSFESDHAYDLPYWVVRGDYDKAMALLDIIEKQFS